LERLRSNSTNGRREPDDHDVLGKDGELREYDTNNRDKETEGEVVSDC
jgi:hypothetical protein